jgi:amino acid transporter
MTSNELKKSLGTFQLIALGVSGVIGAGWIYTNGTFFDEYGAGGMIFGLALGSLLAACVALSYAKLTELFPRAGGEVVFSYTILGRSLGFWTGWLLIGAYISSLAFYFTAFGQLLGRFTPLMEKFPLYSVNGEAVTLPVLLAGLALAILFFVLNYYGVSLGAQLQTVMFVALLVIGLALAVVGFTAGSFDNFWPPFREDQAPVSSILRFVVPGMTYMAGFGLVATLAEDAKIPARKIGRLVVATVLIAGSFYCIVLASSATILPWEQVAGMPLGTITAFEEAGFPILSWGAFAIAILGLLTSFLGLYMATSRIIVALARVDLLPRSLSKLDRKHRTPRNALLFVLIVTIALGWLGPGAIVWFLDTGGIYLGIVWIIVVTAQYLLPKKYPHLSNRSKVKVGFLPAFGAIGAALVIILALIPGRQNSLVWPSEYIILILWFAVGAVLYFIQSRKKTDENEMLSALLGEHVSKLDPAQESSRTAREANIQPNIQPKNIS